MTGDRAVQLNVIGGKVDPIERRGIRLDEQDSELVIRAGSADLVPFGAVERSHIDDPFIHGFILAKNALFE